MALTPLRIDYLSIQDWSDEALLWILLKYVGKVAQNDWEDKYELYKKVENSPHWEKMLKYNVKIYSTYSTNVA